MREKDCAEESTTHSDLLKGISAPYCIFSEMLFSILILIYCACRRVYVIWSSHILKGCVYEMCAYSRRRLVWSNVEHFMLMMTYKHVCLYLAMCARACKAAHKQRNNGSLRHCFMAILWGFKLCIRVCECFLRNWRKKTNTTKQRDICLVWAATDALNLIIFYFDAILYCCSSFCVVAYISKSRSGIRAVALKKKMVSLNSKLAQ